MLMQCCMVHATYIINDLCPLSGSQISEICFTYGSVQTQEISVLWIRLLQDLILRTRLCGTGFVTQCGSVVLFPPDQNGQADIVCTS